MKRTITPNIHSIKSAKQAWNILAGLYAGCNEAKIKLLRKELESKIMNEEDDMDTFLAGVKEINEQLIFAGEIISDSSLVQTVLDDLPVVGFIVHYLCQYGLNGLVIALCLTITPRIVGCRFPILNGENLCQYLNGIINEMSTLIRD
ncbi:hypothetical protein L7F22_008440 [Adiantum nelumboides]|nr:hypothetical protein [Adiantum nelumboides]